MLSTPLLTAQDFDAERGIEEQFDYFLDKSNSYQKYKVIPRTDLAAFKGVVLDSLSTERQNLAEAQARIDEQAANVDELEAQTGDLQGEIDRLNGVQDSISFLGFSMSKSAYQTVVWSIIGGLLALLALFVFLFWRRNLETQQARESQTSVQLQFDEHKRTALKREQEIMRRLQDEINRAKKNQEQGRAGSNADRNN